MPDAPDCTFCHELLDTSRYNAEEASRIHLSTTCPSLTTDERRWLRESYARDRRGQ